MKPSYTNFLITGVTIIATQQLSAGDSYTFSLKNKSPRAVQIELMQQLSYITKLRSVQAGDMFTADINIKEPTKMYLHYCPNDTWCKTTKPERMTVVFTPKKQIHVVYDGEKIRPQLKRLKNVGSGDIQ